MNIFVIIWVIYATLGVAYEAYVIEKHNLIEYWNFSFKEKKLSKGVIKVSLAIGLTLAVIIWPLGLINDVINGKRR